MSKTTGRASNLPRGATTASSGTAILPVILCGGVGSRLWPVSRRGLPKQFHALNGTGSLLAETVARVQGADFGAPLIVSGTEQRFLVAQALSDIWVEPAGILLEPEGRNTAPALALAALWAAAHLDEQAVLAALPADHSIADVEGFRGALATAVTIARSGRIVTFGIVPDRPHTGYGYIEAGAALAGEASGYALARFVEKPERGAAKQMLEAGGFFWNSGIFVATAETLLSEVQSHAPEILAACQAAMEGAERDLDFLRVDAPAFLEAPSISLDQAVMERTERAAVVPVEIGWSDVGSWQALWEMGPKDRDGNVVMGRARVQDSQGCLLRSDGPLLAAVGLRDIALIATGDAVLAIPRARAEEVRSLVDDLEAEGYAEYELHQEVHRPWGSYRHLSFGDRFQVKELLVRPGQALSLQLHHHRAEHWVVVEGTAETTCGEEVRFVAENQSLFIPLGEKHRLKNPGKLPLRLIEVQTGAYLGEDDIVRFQDDYRREGSQ